MPSSFPETQRTWITKSLAQGKQGKEAASCHVMEVYLEPLTAYARRFVFNETDHARDLVCGFLADRMSRENFLNQWIASGKSLRRWLLTGFAYFLLETRRKEARHSRNRVAASDELEGESISPEREFYRSFAVSALQTAMNTAKARCESEGHAERWTLYHEVRYSGRPVSEVASELGIQLHETSGMLKFAARRLIAALHEILLRDGASPDALSKEMQELLRELQP